MKKRGQGLSLYMIIGIVLVGIFLLIIYLTSNINIRPMSVEVSDSGVLKAYIDSCLEKVGERGLFILGRQGGYTTELPMPHHAEPYANVGYIFYNGEKTTPTLETIKLQFDEFINSELPDCLNGFDEFKKAGVEVSENNVKSDVMFAAKDVVLTVEYPITITSGSTTIKLDKFMNKFPVRIRRLHEIAEGLSDRKLAHPDYIDMTYLGNLEVRSTILTDNDGEQVVVFEDPNSKLDDKQYRFLVALA